MCIAFPARVVGFHDLDAIVEVGGSRRRASMLMRPEIAAGDWVLIGAGSVLRSISAAEAAELAQALDAARNKTDARLKSRIRGDGWRWLGAKPEAGGVPNHAFHVLDVFPKVGLLRTGEVDNVLKVMDSCRIRWGRVLERDGESLVVSAVPLDMVDGKLRLGPPRAERIRGWVDGTGFVEDASPGDVVAIHWDWACERLDAARLAALRRSTAAELRLANQTL